MTVPERKVTLYHTSSGVASEKMGADDKAWKGSDEETILDYLGDLNPVTRVLIRRREDTDGGKVDVKTEAGFGVVRPPPKEC